MSLQAQHNIFPKVRLITSVYPSIWKLKALQNCKLVLNLLMNFTSLREVIYLWNIMCKDTTSWKNKFVTLEASLGFFTSNKICYLGKPLNNHKNRISSSAICGNPKIKFMDKSNKIISGTGNSMYNLVSCINHVYLYSRQKKNYWEL